MITDSYTLEWLREIAGEFLPDTCDIYAASGGKDSSYGVSRGTTLRASGVDCRLTVQMPSQGSPVEAVLAIDQRGVYTPFILTLPWNTTILPTDTVIHSGTTYEVISLSPEESTRTVRRVIVRRRD